MSNKIDNKLEHNEDFELDPVDLATVELSDLEFEDSYDRRQRAASNADSDLLDDPDADDDETGDFGDECSEDWDEDNE